MARILSIATAVPGHSTDLPEAERLLRLHLNRLGERPDAYVRILRNLKIERRHTVVPAAELLAAQPLKQRNDAYISSCVALGEQVTRAALAKAELAPSDVDAIITVSCTGYMVPSVDAYLINRLGMSSNTRRTPITELGCVAGAVGLVRAWEQMRVYPRSRILLLAIELSSLTFQPDDRRPTQIIASLLFTDGAAAVVLADDGTHPSPRILASRMYTMPGTIDDMGFCLDGDGLHIVLSPGVPELIQQTLPTQVDALLAEHGVTRADLRWCAMHPAGPKVLEVVERELGFSREQLASSWRVLRNYGNMSSAAVLFVLADMLEHPPARAGDLGLIVAFGPGVTGEIILARWEE